MLPTHYHRYNFLLIPLFFVVQLAGCRSERAAFAFESDYIKSIPSINTQHQQERLTLTDSIPIEQAVSRCHHTVNNHLPVRRVADGQQRSGSANSVAAKRAPKEIRIIHLNKIARPQHAASDGNAEFFAVLFGVVGLVMVLFGLVTWLGIVLLVAAFLFALASLFGGKIGG